MVFNVPVMTIVQAADDFTVPVGPIWSLNAIRFLNGHADCRIKKAQPWSVNIYIFSDDAGLPGTLIESMMDQEVLDLASNGYGVNLDSTIQLGEGVYWISYQWEVGGDPCNAGVRTRAEQSGYPYAVQGLNGCVTWGVGITCNDVSYDPDLNPDLAFALYDEFLFSPTEVPAISGLGLVTFIAILGLSGLLILRRQIKKKSPAFM